MDTDEQVAQILQDSLTAHGVEQWMVAPNRMLGGRTPRKVEAAGEHDKVLRAAQAFVDGAYL